MTATKTAAAKKNTDKYYGLNDGTCAIVLDA